MKFAIVDIETTGGHASGGAITEVAILIHDGQSVIDSFETLIDPLRPIPYYIQTLTGIDEEMIRTAPTFAQVAHRIYELLAGCIFVAHNVNFDYSFLKHHLALNGYDLNSTKLCTVRLSRKIRPGLPSYSLGKLCHALGIDIENRHRARGDADATAILFSKLLAWDTEGHIRSMLKKTSKEQALPPNVPKQDFDLLPQCPGVYYFHDRKGKVIYVGKANNIRKRVSSHFTGHNPNPQRLHFLHDIYNISYEIWGTELMALLKEASEIKAIWPKYNRALKRYDPKFGLFLYEDRNDYLRLAIGKYNKSLVALHEFQNNTDAVSTLHYLCREYGLCPELCSIGACEDYCRECEADKAKTRTELHGDPAVYNTLVEKALATFKDNLPSFAIVDKGRHEEERSCIWVEKGTFYGMGYIAHDTDLQDPEEIKACLTRYGNSQYVMTLIDSYAAKYPYRVKRFEQLCRQAV
ncbi:MAG TPA: exonuclease domain-containing protein [Chitinophagaceae bacterium]|nr:exonuclease domain-containing protein [Chitinophagaceae bacterium]